MRPSGEDPVPASREQQWAAAVEAAVLRLLEPRASVLASIPVQVDVLRTWTEIHDGRPMMSIVYRHPWWSFTTGLRRYLALSTYPLNGGATVEVWAEDFAWHMVVLDITEPLGTVVESMVPDDEGVWWWGDLPLPGDQTRRGPAPRAPHQD